MDKSGGRAPTEPEAIDEIDNLNTARMTLRWALERLHSLERLTEELTQKLEIERQARANIERECRELKGEAVAPQPNERKRYYEVTEQYALRALAGKLDIGGLVTRELEAAKLKESAQLLLERLRQDETAARLTVEKLTQWEAAAQLKLEQLSEKEAWYHRQEEDRASAHERLKADYEAKAKELGTDLQGLRAGLAGALKLHQSLLTDSQAAMAMTDEEEESKGDRS